MSLSAFLEKHPYLAFRLSLEKGGVGRFTFPEVKIRVKDHVEVLFIDGVLRCFDSLKDFLSRGGHLVFIEKNIAKINRFLALPNFPFESKIDIVLAEEMGYQEIAWKTLFQEGQFVGPLKELKGWIDSVHMVASEYRDFGARILGNVQANLLHTDSCVDGRTLKNCFQGVPAIVCGSGPSLERSYDWLREVGDRALVIAAGSAVPKLLKEGIKVHFGAFVDPQPPLDIYKEMGDFSFPIFYQNRMCRDLFSLHQGTKIWMGSSGGWELEEWIYREIGQGGWFFDGGWNAGNFALHIADYLGALPIHLIGMDGGIRRDLEHGKIWNHQFKTVDTRPTLAESYDFTLRGGSIRIDQGRVQKVCERIRGDELIPFLNRYLETGERHAEVVMESELIGHPVYEHLLHPLWKIYRPLYLREAENEAAMRAVFFRDVLMKRPREAFSKDGVFYFDNKKEGKIERRYPSGALYAIECYQNGLRHGEWLSFYESGELKSHVEYSCGALHGKFLLYFKNGKKREGSYHRGRKEGIHRLWNEDGALVLEAAFSFDRQVGLHQRFYDQGEPMEKIVHHPDGRFDKWLFHKNGGVKYEGVFEGEIFREHKYDKGVSVHTREGRWQQGKVIWT